MLIRQREKIAVLLLSDVLAMVIAFGIALVLGHRPPVHLGLYDYYFWGIVTLLLSNIVIFIILDVYSLHRIPARFAYQMLLIGSGLALSAVIVTFIFFFFRDQVPRAVFILFYLFSWTLIAIFRYLHSRITLSRIYWRMVLVGDAPVCGDIANLIRERKYLRTQVVGYVSDDGDRGATSGLLRLSATKDLLETVRREGIDQVVVAVPSVGPALMKDLLDCMKRKVRVTDFRHLIEYVTGTVPIEHLSANWFINELAGLDRRYTWFMKRALDIVISAIGSVLSFPLILLAAAAIKVDSRGSVFYSQIRIGRGGRKFRVWKLRTMVSHADKNNVYWTEDNDDRITPVGALLRKMHIDELPQIINILMGHMSFIGPRPEAEALVEMYVREIPFYQERHMVTPGVTGWAQINFPYGNSIEDTREKLKYDYYYIKNRSILLDLLILLRTIKTVVTGKGAL